MMEENKTAQPLTEQEQKEVAKLFQDFATLSSENTIEEKNIEAAESVPEFPPKNKLSKKKLLCISISSLLTLLLIAFSIIYFIDPSDSDSKYVTFSAGNHLVAAVTNAGTVLSPSGSSSLSGYMVTMQTTDVLNWKDIVSISVGTLHTLGLKSDGTVVTTSFYAPDKVPNGSAVFGHPKDKGQLNVANWNNIIAIAAGYQHSVGLRKDGTVVAVGDNVYGQCDVESWTDIIQISAGQYHTVGLKKDGTVVSTKIHRPDSNDFSANYNADLGQCNTDTWKDIVYICAGSETTFGVRSDGTVVAAGNNVHGQCNVATWTNIVTVAAGLNHTVGLREDGTVVSTVIYQPLASSYIADYNQGAVSHWKDIVAVAVTNQQTFGLKADGTVIYAGLNTAENNETKKWDNIRIP